MSPKCHDGYCLVPAGCFVKGSAPTDPYRGVYTEDQRAVTLTHAFVMGIGEVTQAAWTSAGYPNLAGTKNDGAGGTDCVAPDCPASTMTVFEAIAYANKQSDAKSLPHCIELDACTGSVGVDFQCTGYHQTTASYYDCTGFRLPTQIEFEYALRAGTTTAFYSGPFEPLPPIAGQYIDIPHLDGTAWYCTNSDKKTHPVLQKTPNPWGFFDMMGNAAEFVASDPIIFDQGFSPETDPDSVLNDAGVFGYAGGTFYAWPTLLRSADIPETVFMFGGNQRQQAGAALGFRLVRSLNATDAAKW